MYLALPGMGPLVGGLYFPHYSCNRLLIKLNKPELKEHSLTGDSSKDSKMGSNQGKHSGSARCNQAESELTWDQ